MNQYTEAHKEAVALEERFFKMKAALIQARAKLELYRAAYGGEYVGGVEYSELIHRIDAALGDLGQGSEEGK